MENRLKRFGPWLVALLVIVALAFIQAQAFEWATSPRNFRTPLREAMNEVVSRLQAAEARHAEAARLDFVRGEGGTEPVTFVHTAGLDSATQRAVQDRLRAELAAVPGPRQARLVIATVPADFGYYYGGSSLRRPLNPIAHYQAYAGRDSTGPWCAVVGVRGEIHEDVSPPDSRSPDLTPFFGRRTWQGERVGAGVLGPCRWWLRYGEPGHGLAAWFENGGALLLDADPLEADTERSLLERRGPFGLRSPLGSAGREGVFLEACLAGRSSACIKVMDSLPSTSKGIALYERPRYRDQFLGPGDRELMTEVEREFGPVRFAAFWTSDAPPVEAFEAAFGVPFGDWVSEWARERYGAEPLGPRLDLGTVLTSLLTLALFAGASVLIVQRRSVR